MQLHFKPFSSVASCGGWLICRLIYLLPLKLFAIQNWGNLSILEMWLLYIQRNLKRFIVCEISRRTMHFLWSAAQSSHEERNIWLASYHWLLKLASQWAVFVHNPTSGLSLTAKMSAGESMGARFEKIDAMLKDPKSEVNTDCLLVSL